MLGFVSLSILVYIITSLIVGVRLLLLARRTRGFPEFVVGMGFMLVGGSGYPISAISGYGVKPAGEVIYFAFALGNLLNTAGIFCFTLFNWRTFRANALWARILTGVTGLGLVTVSFAVLRGMAGADPKLASHLVAHTWSSVAYPIYLVPFVWSAAESLREYSQSRRRQAVGLADSVVTNRFMLWSIFSLCASGMAVANFVAHLGRQPIFENPGALFATGLGAVITSAAIYLAFAPPARYLAFVRGSGTTASS